MLGSSTALLPTPLDLTDAVDRSLDQQVIRVDPTSTPNVVSPARRVNPGTCT